MDLKATITTKGAVFEGKGPEIIREALVSVMYEVVAFMEGKVHIGTPVGVYGAQGGLLSTVHGEVEKGIPVVKGVVAHTSPYGDVVEKGRTAGKAMPPEGTLLRWLEVKLGLDEVTAKRIEYVVRRKIGRKGFEGAFMFERAFEDNFSTVMGMFDRAGFDIARRLS